MRQNLTVMSACALVIPACTAPNAFRPSRSDVIAFSAARTVHIESVDPSAYLWPSDRRDYCSTQAQGFREKAVRVAVAVFEGLGFEVAPTAEEADVRVKIGIVLTSFHGKYSSTGLDLNALSLAVGGESFGLVRLAARDGSAIQIGLQGETPKPGSVTVTSSGAPHPIPGHISAIETGPGVAELFQRCYVRRFLYLVARTWPDRPIRAILGRAGTSGNDSSGLSESDIVAVENQILEEDGGGTVVPARGREESTR